MNFITNNRDNHVQTDNIDSAIVWSNLCISFYLIYLSVASIHECIVLDCFRLQTVVWDCNNNVAVMMLLLLLLWDEEAQAGYLQTVFLCTQTAQTLIICGHTQDTILKKHRQQVQSNTVIISWSSSANSRPGLFSQEEECWN